MTDEERAEEYADDTRIIDENTRVGDDCISLVQDFEGNTLDIHERIKKAYLDGFNADRWHYPSKGEYPTKTDDYLLIIKPEGMRVFAIGAYFVGAKEWRYVTCNYEEGCDEPIAWMPLPEPPKEEA